MSHDRGRLGRAAATAPKQKPSTAASVLGSRREQIFDAASALVAERAFDEVLDRGHRQLPPASPAGSCSTTLAGRKEVCIGLLEWLGAQREERFRPPVVRRARARVADIASR
jgi:hypothetical protein